MLRQADLQTRFEKGLIMRDEKKTQGELQEYLIQNGYKGKPDGTITDPYGKVIRGHVSKYGKLMFTVYMDFGSGKKESKPFYFNRFVWQYFFGEVPLNHVVVHKDDNLTNNDLSNLKIIQKQELIKKVSRKGEDVPSAKLTKEDVIMIKKMLQRGEQVAVIHKYFDHKVGFSAIQCIKENKTWRSVKV